VSNDKKIKIVPCRYDIAVVNDWIQRGSAGNPDRTNLACHQRRHQSWILPGRYELGAKLAAIAGASAGGINALVSAMSWCMDERLMQGKASDTISSNLFRDIWLDVGFKICHRKIHVITALMMAC